MASSSQLSAKFAALLVAIAGKINGKLDAGAKAADSALLDGKNITQVGAAAIAANLGGVNGRKGELPFFTQDGVPMALGSAELLTQLRMANDDTTIANLKSASVSFCDIFNK